MFHKIEKDVYTKVYNLLLIEEDFIKKNSNNNFPITPYNSVLYFSIYHFCLFINFKANILFYFEEKIIDNNEYLLVLLNEINIIRDNLYNGKTYNFSMLTEFIYIKFIDEYIQDYERFGEEMNEEKEKIFLINEMKFIIKELFIDLYPIICEFDFNLNSSYPENKTDLCEMIQSHINSLKLDTGYSYDSKSFIDDYFNEIDDTKFSIENKSKRGFHSPSVKEVKKCIKRFSIFNNKNYYVNLNEICLNTVKYSPTTINDIKQCIDLNIINNINLVEKHLKGIQLLI